MQFKSQITVTGAKRSKGEYEGRPYDSTKLYVQMSMDGSNGDAVGSAGAEYNWGTSVNFLKLQHQKFPFNAEATFEIVTNGRSQKQILVDVKPV